MNRRAAVLVVAVAAFGLWLWPARAGGVLVVDDDPDAGTCHAGHAAFATIQAPSTRRTPATPSGSARASTTRPSR